MQQCTIAHSTRSPYLNEILSALPGLLPTRNHQVPAAGHPLPPSFSHFRASLSHVRSTPRPTKLIIISEHTSLWHYYNDCCSKIHNAPDSNTLLPLAGASRIFWVPRSVLPAVSRRPLGEVERKANKQKCHQTDTPSVGRPVEFLDRLRRRLRQNDFVFPFKSIFAERSSFPK